MKKVFLAFAVFICVQAFPQSRIFNGYYITNEGDTIKGSFPGYSQWSRNPSKVRFQTPQNQSVELTAHNCAGFLVEGYDEYVAYTGKRLLNPVEDQQLIDNETFWDRNDKDTAISGFLRVIYKSRRFELFAFNDPVRVNFFYRLPHQAIEELRFKKYFDQNKIIEVDEYRQQIKNMFLQYITNKKLSKSLELLAYQEETFRRFFERLLEEHIEETTKNPDHGWIFSAGISINKFDVRGDSFGRWNDFDNSVAPLLSVGHLFPFNRNFGRFFLYPQLKLYRYKNSSTAATTYAIRTTTFKAELVLLPEFNAGINLVNDRRVQVFLSCGLGMLGMVKARQTTEIESAASLGNSELKLSKMTGTANLSTGLRLNKKISLSASYYFPTPVGNFTEYTPQHSSLQVGFGYKFK